MSRALAFTVGVCVALTGIAAPLTPTKVQSAPSLTRQATGYGLNLQLTIRCVTYPRDALARVTIRLTNTSSRAISVTGNDAPVCVSRDGLGIEVRTKHGHVVYPPAAPWELASCGKHVLPTTVPPGKSLSDHPLVVLRGPRVRAIVAVVKLGHTVGELKTSAFHIRLTPRDRPPITFSTNGGTRLTIGPVPWRHADLRYVESGVCLHPGDGGGGSGTGTWERLLANTSGVYSFGMPCDGSVIWAFTGGMLNHSVVSETVS